MKELTIRLSKELLDNDIDHRTYKRTEASLQNLPDVGKNAAASDTEEGHDKSIITRYRDYRDAKIRKRLMRWLTNEIDSDTFTNRLREESKEYVYTFSVPDNFRTEMMASIKDYLHEYIIRGTLYDWYKYAGLPYVDTEDMLEDLENSIVSAFRGKPCMTRPLQPFGPPFPKTPLF